MNTPQRRPLSQESIDEDRRQRAADAGGYFWVPCPKCGEFFGGNEPKGGTVRRSHETRTASMCCVNCPGDWVVSFEPLRRGAPDAFRIFDPGPSKYDREPTDEH